MTPQQFVSKWQSSSLKESAAAQEHFVDLCRLLGERTPAEADPDGTWFTFEKGAAKTGGGDGWADVWKRGCFAWEYKGRGKDLNVALKQLKLYQGALDNPPLLIVSDMEKIEIHTAWTNMVQEKRVLSLDDLLDARHRDVLKDAFSETGVERLKPNKKRAELTQQVAMDFVALAQNLRARGHAPEKVAHFVNRMVFCMFAEDVKLLPDDLFKRMLEASREEPDHFVDNAQKLFAAMAKPNGRLDFKRIEWFNGGLFDDDSAIDLDHADIEIALKAAYQDWSNIDPSIMGTLFERGLDPDKRSQLGAHYTDPDKIMTLVRPLVIEPLTREWERIKDSIEVEFAKAKEAKDARPPKNANVQRFHQGQRQREENARRRARELFEGFLDRLKRYRILDPACGSGNFLFLSLKALKDIELKANQDHEALSHTYDMQVGIYTPITGPENMLGIEINPFAAELARVSVWIGEIQWMRDHGFDASRNPILKSLENIVCHDALLNPNGSEFQWPAADVIIGNPPYLGAKLMKGRLGVAETERIRDAFKGRLPGFTDLVCYWFEKSREMIEQGKTARAGLVATNSIRKNTNLPVMHRIAATTRFFEAWSEEQWTINGAAVDVSLVCFGDNGHVTTRLNGSDVTAINPDLTTGLDLTGAAALPENRNTAYLGIQKSGPFDVTGDIARQWFAEPINPNGVRNADILRPYWNGDDVTGRPRDYWFIDLPLGLDEHQASLFQSAFAHISTTPDQEGKTVRQLRNALGDRAGPRWWEPHWPRPEMRACIAALPRYIVTPETALHRLFVWLSPPVLPDKNLIVIARDDDCTFGILHSKAHALWALRKGSDLEDRPRYTHTTTFATFPFPGGLTPDIPAADYQNHPQALAIAAAARQLDRERRNWLNPSNLVKCIPEDVPNMPERILPVDAAAERQLRTRTLTDLYNDPPPWLISAHRQLDRAVADAYGWTDWGNDGLPDDVILQRLFDLNQQRAGRTPSD